MKKKKLLFLIASMMTIWICGGFGQEKPTNSIEGTWLGTLKVSGSSLGSSFVFRKGPDGTLSAVMDSPDQGAKDIPTSSVILENDRLTIEVKSRRSGL